MGFRVSSNSVLWMAWVGWGWIGSVMGFRLLDLKFGCMDLGFGGRSMGDGSG